MRTNRPATSLQGMCEHFEGLGVTVRELQPGTIVMVPVGRLVAAVNGHPCLIAWAIVRGPAGDAAAKLGMSGERYWLDVYTIPGGPPVPQMYAPGEIIGVPALGLSMDGAPERSLLPDR